MGVWFVTKIVLYAYFTVLCPLYFMFQVKHKRNYAQDISMLIISMIVSFYAFLSLYKEFT